MWMPVCVEHTGLVEPPLIKGGSENMQFSNNCVLFIEILERKIRVLAAQKTKVI